MSTYNNVMCDVNEERLRQDKKWGIQTHTDRGWLPILAEEFGEVANAMNEPDLQDHIREELIQVAAVAVAWVECIDRRIPRG